jgi:hypothetical protein
MAMMQAAMHVEEDFDMMDIHDPAVPEHQLQEALAFFVPDALDIAAAAVAVAVAAAAGAGADAVAADGGPDVNDAAGDDAVPVMPPNNAAEAAAALQGSAAAFNEQMTIVQTADDTARNQFLVALGDSYTAAQRSLIDLSIGNVSNCISEYTNAVRDRKFVYADGLPGAVRPVIAATIDLLEQQVQQLLAQDVDQLHVKTALQCVKHGVIAYLQQIADAFGPDGLPTRHRAIKDAIYYCELHSDPRVSQLLSQHITISCSTLSIAAAIVTAARADCKVFKWISSLFLQYSAKHQMLPISISIAHSAHLTQVHCIGVSGS